MSTTAPVAGLSIRRRDQPLEEVNSKSGGLRLLVSAGMEVAEGNLHAGERMTLVPAPGSEATEGYYLLVGELVHEGAGGAERLGPGDTLVTRDLTAEVILTAVGEVRFLYFTSEPFFHQISVSLNELMRLAVEVELKDGYTAEHCLRLQRLSFATGRELGLPAQRLHLLDYGAYLHDVGKIKVPVEILTKPSRLDEGEWEIVRRHPTYGRELLEPTFMRDAGRIVEQHHERLDGSGYPYGLGGDEILPEAMIVAIADTYDAMTTDRSYRKALPREVAVAEIDRWAGTHYPRDFVRAFTSALDGCEGKR